MVGTGGDEDELTLAEELFLEFAQSPSERFVLVVNLHLVGEAHRRLRLFGGVPQLL